ncbi:MAG: Fe-S cluster assembly protein SufD [Actinobacteria bacterium]|nr:Fe-S cluster assembly protein SufD [Actinomycetota bacterium]
MESAFDVFEKLDEPTGSEEDWRYVSYDLPFSELNPVVEPGDPLPSGPFTGRLTELAGRALIVDGAILETDGAMLARLSEIEPDRHRSLVPVDHNKLAAAHAAFADDGLYVDFTRPVETPVLVEIQTTAAGTASFPHVSIRVADHAEGRVLVVYRSSPGARLLSVPEIDIDVADGGHLRLLAIQGLDQAATGVVHQRMTLGRDATGRIGEVGLGGDFGRLDLGVDLIGDGSSAQTVGLYFGEGSQTLDYRVLIRHVGRNTTSDVFLKGAVEDDAESVFTGLLRIERDAVRTSTFETNRNLVLSENAKAHSVPNLEILCHDVMCGHASSVGPLEQDHLYYLQSRGLPRPRAERLLIRGFFQEVIDRLPIPGIEGPVSEEVFRRFVTAQEEGRVA